MTENLYPQASHRPRKGLARAREDEWSERGSVADEGGLVMTFRGINQDEQDLLDAQDFVRGLKAPVKPNPDYEATMARSSDGTESGSPQAQRLATGVMSVVVTKILMPALFGAGGFRWWVLVALLLAFPAGYFAPSFLFLLGPAPSMPIRCDVRGDFECQLTTKRFRCSGFRCDVSFELTAVAAFAGDTHLSLLLTDGRTVRLPARLESRRHGALAARLNEVLREAKSVAHGYRGLA